METTPRSDPAAPLILAGLSAIADRYDVLLCDLWGVMHDGQQASGDAIDAVTRFRAKGGTVVFITNAPRPHDAVTEQIVSLGVPDDAYDGIVTSGDVTVAAIVAEGDATFFHIGPPRDLALFEVVRRERGVPARLTGLAEAACVVVTGLFDDRTETPDDYAEQLAAMRARDLPMICANPDVVVQCRPDADLLRRRPRRGLSRDRRPHGARGQATSADLRGGPCDGGGKGRPPHRPDPRPGHRRRAGDRCRRRQ